MVVLFTMYHLLLIKSHYSVPQVLCLLMLGDFPALLRAFVRTTTVVDGLENYPVFLSPRLMAQAEFVEMLECVTGGWHVSIGVWLGVWLCVSVHGPCGFSSTFFLWISGPTFTHQVRWGIRCCFGFPMIEFSAFQAYSVDVRVSVFFRSYK